MVFYTLFTVLLLSVTLKGITLDLAKVQDTNVLSSKVTRLREEIQLIQGQKSGKFQGSLPFSEFIENLGQFKDKTLRYSFSSERLKIGFYTSEIAFVSITDEESKVIRFSVTFPGSNKVLPTGIDKKNHLSNYFQGTLEITNAPSWNEVWYYDLYPGIDLRYYMSEKGLKYDFLVHSGADPNQICIEVSNDVNIIIKDQLIIIQESAKDIIQETGLKVFQEDGTVIKARFIPKLGDSHTYGYQISRYDQTQKLIIDPLWLSFSTYIGGAGEETGEAIVVDSEGNSYITGAVLGADFPIKNAYDSTHNGGYDVYVLKLNAEGDEIIFSTYLGGGTNGIADTGADIAVDENNSVYITGRTLCNDFPTKNAYQNTNLGSAAAFVTKLNATGNGLIFSTYLGGTGVTYGITIEIDTDGNSYIGGNTDSSNFPVKNAYQSSNKGGNDGFVTKLNATGNGLIYSTYIGGLSDDYINSIALDDGGNCYFTGFTTSNDYPVMNAYQSSRIGSNEAFVTKLNTTGNGLVFSTYLGDSGNDVGQDLTVDSQGNIYLTGYTYSSGFPLYHAYDSTLGGSSDAYLTKLNSTGNGLEYSTFFGGSNLDTGKGIDIDSNGNCYISGHTYSSNLPLVNAFQNSFGGGSYDAYVAKFNSTGTGLSYSTYLGGTADESGTNHGVFINSKDSCYIIGTTNSDDLPTRNAYNYFRTGSTDIFVTKLEEILDESPVILMYSTSSTSQYYRTAFNNETRKALESSGFFVRVEDRSTISTLTSAIFQNISQFWLINGADGSPLSSTEQALILDAWKNGTELVLLGDETNFYANVNLISEKFGVEFEGAYSVTYPQTPTFIDHPIWKNVTTLAAATVLPQLIIDINTSVQVLSTDSGYVQLALFENETGTVFW